jgi:hypothetical protein
LASSERTIDECRSALHDTGILMVERTYSAFIADHADAVARPALIELS